MLPLPFAAQLPLAYGAPYGVSKVITVTLIFVIYGISAWLYQKFPTRRRVLCNWLIAGGLIMLVGCAAFGNASDEVRNAWGVPMIFALVVGFIGAIVGFALLKKINREGE